MQETRVIIHQALEFESHCAFQRGSGTGSEGGGAGVRLGEIGSSFFGTAGWKGFRVIVGIITGLAKGFGATIK